MQPEAREYQDSGVFFLFLFNHEYLFFSIVYSRTKGIEQCKGPASHVSPDVGPLLPEAESMCGEGLA